MNTLLISRPQCKYNTKFLKGRSEHCKRKEKRNEFDEGNARIWVRISSFIYSWQGIETTAHKIIMNDILAQVFFSQFCKICKNTLVKKYGFKCGWCGFNGDYPHWNYIDKVSNMAYIWFLWI